MNQILNTALVTAANEILSSIGLTNQRSIAGPAIGSFLAGAVVGAAAGLLLAPTSGEELIAKLTARATALRDTVMKSVGSTSSSSTSNGESDGAEKSNRTRPQSTKYVAAQG